MKMKFLIIAIIMMLPQFLTAGAPSPLDRQAEYFSSRVEIQRQQLNHDHEVANLMNQIYDLQLFNLGLLKENAELKASPEKIYIEKTVVKEKQRDGWPWWVFGLGGIAVGLLF